MVKPPCFSHSKGIKKWPTAPQQTQLRPARAGPAWPLRPAPWRDPTGSSGGTEIPEPWQRTKDLGGYVVNIYI